MRSSRGNTPWTWRPMDIIFITVLLLKMILQHDWGVKTLKAEWADEALLGRAAATIAKSSCWRLCHRFCLVGNVFEEVHVSGLQRVVMVTGLILILPPVSCLLSPQFLTTGHCTELSSQVEEK